ncbi:MAG TPA: hypothetical protein PLW18_01775, partial [Candidatus Dojkabacteria bacterium]|nr:hypothetical protein [Candidatus Dojkabacteria bacterium]
MEDNTAQNNTIQYPNVPQDNSQIINPNISTTPTPTTSTSGVQPSVQTQTGVSPTAEVTADAQSINLAPSPSDEGVLKGIVSNPLEEIIPGEKVPKALKREPKEVNLAQPIFVEQPEPPIIQKLNEP